MPKILLQKKKRTSIFYKVTQWKAAIFAGRLAIAVLGQIAGMWEAWSRFGRVPWRELLQPAVDMARYGMRVDAHLAGAITDEETSIREQRSLRYSVCLVFLELLNNFSYLIYQFRNR